MEYPSRGRHRIRRWRAPCAAAAVALLLAMSLGCAEYESRHLESLSELRLAQGQNALNDGRFVEAEDLVHLALLLDDTNHDAHLWMGRIQLTRYRLERAESRLRRAIELAPQAPDSYYLLGYLFELEGAFPRAAAYYRKHLALLPPDSDSVLQAEIETLAHFLAAFGTAEPYDHDKATPPASVAFAGERDREDALPLVPVSINGLPERAFYLDTKQTGYLRICRETAEATGLITPAPNDLRGLRPGAGDDSYLMLIDSLSLGPLTIRNVPASVEIAGCGEQVGSVGGKIGSLDLRLFLITFDFPRDSLTLIPYPDSLDEYTRFIDAVTSRGLIIRPRFLNGRVYVEGEIGERRGLLLLDTGALRSTVVSSNASLSGGPGHAMKGGMPPDPAAQQPEGSLYPETARDVWFSFGGLVERTDVVQLVYERTHPLEIGRLGLDILGRYRVTLSYRGSFVMFE
jgi:tetratricopeptide (TPR) repeat protein